MKFTITVFRLAAVYGFVSLVPLYFVMDRIAVSAPPAITHPEFYFGFIGLALLWQFVFLLIAGDPIRYRQIVPITILEKFVYSVPVFILYAQGKVHPSIVPTAIIDLTLGVLFVASYFQLRRAEVA